MRARRDVNEAAQFASAAFAKDMLGVADNFVARWRIFRAMTRAAMPWPLY